MRNIIEQFDRLIEIINHDFNCVEHYDSLCNMVETFYTTNKNENGFEENMIVKSLYLVAKEKLEIRYERMEQAKD